MDFVCACLKPRNATRGREGSLGGHRDTAAVLRAGFPGLLPPACHPSNKSRLGGARGHRNLTRLSRDTAKPTAGCQDFVTASVGCGAARDLCSGVLLLLSLFKPLRNRDPGPGFALNVCVCLKMVPRRSLGAAIAVCSPHKAPLTLVCCPGQTSSQRLTSDISTLSLTLECKHAAAEEKQRCSELTQPGALGEDSCAVSVTGITRALPTA